MLSRIIDALEATPAVKIDPKRVAVTGCSRNGKGAFVAGAFEPRIALTIPQESGSGGAACWRQRRRHTLLCKRPARPKVTIFVQVAMISGINLRALGAVNLQA